MALFGLTCIAGYTLFQAFENQAREGLRTRTQVLARGMATVLVEASSGEFPLPAPKDPLESTVYAFNSWLEADGDFSSLVLREATGEVVVAFPKVSGEESTIPRGNGILTQNDTKFIETSDEFIAIVPVISSGAPPRFLELRMSTDRLHAELKSIRWLFISIFLLAGVVFVALSVYLTRGVVLPLEEIRRAAQRIASGEANVKIPLSGDREIDEIAQFFHSIAERRPSPANPHRSPLPGTGPRADSPRTGRTG